ncbi:hypothetical protein AB0F91_43515 [Amycolatopsis sp. NPDC023774]|uniref:hypothetical protein n=1 Tax=Amycolatopsis sp. NPDC023774 TaxID=3155015 RepID=UPI0033E29C0C
MVAQYGLRGSTYHSVLVTVGTSGNVLWHQEYDREVRIRADLGGTGFLALPPGKMEERSTRGDLLQSVDDVADARYDESGAIVLVTGLGEVRWMPSRSRTHTG